MMTENAVDVWRAAESFQELCENTMQWLRGDLLYCPTYAGSPDPETNEIVEPLVDLNRRGLLTTSSQPAEIGDGYAQRAWVEGFTHEGTARSIAAKALYSDLHILAFPPGVEMGIHDSYRRC